MIAVNNISFRYHTGHPLFDDVTIKVDAGDRVAVVGDNGSGKTTLLKVIAGHIPPTSGAVNFHKASPKIAFIPANLDYFLLPWYRVCQNISFFQTEGDSLRGFELLKVQREIKRCLPQARNGFTESFVYSLSSGEKAVVALVCALYARPDLIILDEIFSNTSKTVSIEMIRVIKAEVHIPIIFTSHTPEFVGELANKMVSIPR